MTKEFKKIIKPMYLFFDYLYEDLNLIQTDVEDWFHKEKPILKYCVVNIEDDVPTLSSSDAVLFNSHQDAHNYLIEEEYEFNGSLYIWK